MSELKGSLLGVILVLILFGTLSACLTAAFASMTTAATNQVSEVVQQTQG
ncbi:MAG: hypothetical protein WCS49_02890 [Bacilli bacterium]